MTGDGIGRALVTGATGAVGPALVRRLVRGGGSVRVLSRHSAPAGLFPGPVQTQQGDVTDPVAVARAVEGVDVVFHLAARLHETAPALGMAGEYERVNVGGTQAVAEGAARAGVRRLVHFSTISVYGPTSGGVADETTAPRPDSLYAQTKLRAEETALRVRRRDTSEPLACVLRMAAVYGPRMKGNYRRLAGAVASGWFVPIGDGQNRRTLVHEQDAAEAALAAAVHPDAAGRTYNVTDGQVHRLRQILEAMAAALGRTPPRWHLPAVLARGGAAFADRLLPLVGGRVRARALVFRYLEDVAVSGAKIERELGVTASFDLDAGWRDALAAMRERA